MTLAKKVTAGLFAGLFAVLASPSGAWAQGPAAPPAGLVKPPAVTAEQRSPEQLRKEVLERMRALRAWRIVDELKLDESASARLFPILAKFDEREMALAVERRDIARELRAELDGPALLRLQRSMARTAL